MIPDDPIPSPTKGEENGTLDFRWVPTMEHRWKDEEKVRAYLSDTKRFPDQSRWGPTLELEWDPEWGWGWGRNR